MKPTRAAACTKSHRLGMRWPWAAVVVASALALAACGSSSKSSSATTASAATTTGATTATTASATTNAASTTAGGTSTGGASAPGVTATSITLGSVAVISGPVPGLFQGAPYGASAYFAYINSQGGVDGRQLKLNSYDDALSCQLNTSGFANNINKVFAFVGSMSVLDNCGAKVLTANPTVSSVAWTLTPQARAVPNQFDPEPQPNGYRLGGFEYYKAAYPNDLKLGGIYGNASGAEVNWNAQVAAMKSVGYKLIYSRAYAPTETSFTSDVLRMKNDGVNFLWITDDDIGTIGRLLNAAAQQNWHPVIASGDTAYDANLPKLLTGSAGQGLLTDQLSAMFQGEDRATVPAVDTFLTWMGKTHPGFQPDLYSVWGWAGAALFVQALKAAGPTPTRAGLLAALKNVHSFSADGMMATSDPGNHTPSQCYLVIKYDNVKKTWQRVTPQTGFQCTPGGYFNYTGS